MYSFFRICILRLPKVLLWAKKNFSWKISIWVSKQRRILCWFQIRWCRLKQMPLKKARAKKLFEFFRFCAFFRGFLLLTFVRGISESRHQWIWNQHKILRVFDTHIDIFQEKIFLGHNSTFCNLKMQSEKNYTFSNILQKVKSYFFQISIILRLIPIKFETLKPPNV